MSAGPVIRAFARGRLPRISPAAAAATRAAGRVVGGRRPSAEVALAGVGALRMRHRGYRAAPADAVTVALPIMHGSARGRVVVDAWLAARLVAGALGAPEPRTLRALGPAERGVLAAHIVATLRALGEDAVVGLGDATDDSDPTRLAFEIEVEAGAWRGLAWLEAPAGWEDGRSPAVAIGSPPVWGQLPVLTAVIACGATWLSRAEVTAAAPGDAVVFEGLPGSPPGGPWGARLCVGPHAAPALLLAGGALRVEGAFEHNGAMSHSPHPATPAAEASPTQVLSSAPVEVVAEIGRLTLRADEILGLRAGSVLAIEGRADAVDIRAGGLPWARGELVDVDGQLAVRVTQLLRA